MAACQNNHLSVVEYLLSLQQTDVNTKDEVRHLLTYTDTSLSR